MINAPSLFLSHRSKFYWLRVLFPTSVLLFVFVSSKLILCIPVSFLSPILLVFMPVAFPTLSFTCLFILPIFLFTCQSFWLSLFICLLICSRVFFFLLPVHWTVSRFDYLPVCSLACLFTCLHIFQSIRFPVGVSVCQLDKLATRLLEPLPPLCDYSVYLHISWLISLLTGCLPLYLPTCQSLCLPTYLPTCLLCLPVYKAVCLPALSWLPVYLLAWLRNYQTAYLPVWLHVCKFVYLSYCQFT